MTPKLHEEPKPHDYHIEYSRWTGDPIYFLCQHPNCHKRVPITYEDVKAGLESRIAHHNWADMKLAEKT